MLLPVGRHRVVLTNQQLRSTKEREVMVRGGATTALKVVMSDPD
jgi:hypothetical protein